MFSPL
jgi:hypothetical protein